MKLLKKFVVDLANDLQAGISCLNRSFIESAFCRFCGLRASKCLFFDFDVADLTKFVSRSEALPFLIDSRNRMFN